MDRYSLELSARPIVAGLLLLLTLIGLLGTAIRDPRPHDIPVGIVAPPPMEAQLRTAFGQASPGAFGFTAYGSEGEARAAVDRRDIVAALIAGQFGPRLVVAGAAGDAVAGAVTGALTNAFRAQGAELTVEVVHPFDAGDPHGIVLFFLVLATLIAAVAAGALAVLPAPGRSWLTQVAVVAIYAASAGVAGALAAAWLSDGYGDRIWLVMGLMALLSIAIASVTAAGARIFGAAGVGLAALVVVLLGLVSSGGPLGSEFLPDAYRAIAPWLPVGPSFSALRGALYFDGAGVTGPVVLLAAWAAIGLVSLATHDLLRSGQPRAVVAHA